MGRKHYLKYSISKNALFNAGEIFKGKVSPKNEQELFEAYDIVNSWRAMHAYPLNTFQASIRKILQRTKITNPIVAQRLKRFASVILKLRRYKTMRLERMQDIGGIRIILNKVSDVYQVRDALLNANWKHVFKGSKDYIEEPQKSGYRSVHIVYEYKNSLAPKEYQGLHIEVQIRTRLQHIWATTVETIGTFVNHSLKSSQGPQKWLDYLKLASAVFSIEEGTTLAEEFRTQSPLTLVEKLYKQTVELDIFTSLDSFHRAMKFSDDKRFKNKFVLLKIDLKKNSGRATIFNQKDFDKATFQYGEFEKTKNEFEDAVLVSTRSLKELKKAYPNYFVDASAFIKRLNKIFKSYGFSEIIIPRTDAEN